MSEDVNKEVENTTQTTPIVEDAEPVERPSDSNGAADQGTEGLLEKLGEVTAEADAMREKYLRVMAEMENLRRRTLRDKEEARRFAALPLVEDLLPIIDNFKLGLSAAHGHEGGKAFAEGFEMILGQLKGALNQHGVVEIAPEGEAFDPNNHEAIAQQPDPSVEEGKVISVQRIGYRLHDRLLRPASVVVSSGPAASSTSSEA